MRREIIKSQIVDIIDAIIEQTQVINDHKGRIPQIEIDIIKKNISELYENYCSLDKLNCESVDEKKSSKTEAKTINTEIKPKVVEKNTIDAQNLIAEPTIEVKNIIEVIPEMKKAEEKKEIKFVENVEPVIHSEETIELIEIPTEISPKVEILDKPVSEPIKMVINQNSTTVADKFKNDNKTLNDSIENKEDKSIVSKMQKAPITDLVKAIGINERFLFTKELFKNDSELYGNAIKSLNEMNGISDAFDFLDDLKLKLDWDENSSACLKIYDLIRRKYQPKS